MKNNLVPVKLSNEEIKFLGKISNLTGMSRSEAIRTCIDVFSLMVVQTQAPLDKIFDKESFLKATKGEIKSEIRG
jgi:hypothetical protein